MTVENFLLLPRPQGEAGRVPSRKRDGKTLVWLKAISGIVRRRRQELRMSQEELAIRSRLHRTYISDVERGARNISLTSFFRLAEALEVKPSSLLLAMEASADAEETGGQAS